MNHEYTDDRGNTLILELLRANDGTICGVFAVVDQHEESEAVDLDQDKLVHLRDELIQAIGLPE